MELVHTYDLSEKTFEIAMNIFHEKDSLPKCYIIKQINCGVLTEEKWHWNWICMDVKDGFEMQIWTTMKISKYELQWQAGKRTLQLKEIDNNGRIRKQ